MTPRRGFELLRIAEAYADALVRVGDRDRAIEVLRTGTSDRQALIPERVLHWVSARNAYAQLLRRLGRDADAEPVERDLLSMLSEADADHVIAAKLRARYGGSAPLANADARAARLERTHPPSRSTRWTRRLASARHGPSSGHRSRPGS